MGEKLAASITVENHDLRTTVQLLLIKGVPFTEGHAIDIKIIAAHAIGTGSHINIVITQAQVLRDGGRGRGNPRLFLDGD